MYSPVETALRTIYHNIPVEILNLCFQPEENRVSLDDLIHERVIVDRVMHDLNVVAGKITQILLTPQMIKPAHMPNPGIYGMSQAHAIYTIPPELREYKNIASVISIRYPYVQYDGVTVPSMYSGSYSSQNNVGSLACQVLDSYTFASATPMPTPINLMGHQIKLIPISFATAQNSQWILNCRLAYDEEFSNLNNQAFMSFAELCLCATKAYIWTKLRIQIESEVTMSGQAFGVIKEIVDSYADQQDKYIELRNQVQGAATSLDPEELQRTLIEYV